MPMLYTQSSHVGIAQVHVTADAGESQSIRISEVCPFKLRLMCLIAQHHPPHSDCNDETAEELCLMPCLPRG